MISNHTFLVRAAVCALFASLPSVSFVPSCHAQQTPPAAAAPAQPPAKPQVVGRAVWDASYLYLTLQVDDINLQGTNTAPMSQPQLDDSVAVYLDFDNVAGSGSVSPASHAMIVSAAGGFTFLRGEAATKGFMPRPLFTIKYAVTLQGTLNRSDDRDRGYTVELAIPWAGLERKATDIKAGASFRYNLVARNRGGKSLASLAAGVDSEADVTIPTKWTRLTLAETDGTGAAAATGQKATTAYRLAARAMPPLIDGVPRPAEWPQPSRFAFDAPAQSATETAVVAAPATNAPQNVVVPPVRLNENLRRMDGRIFARYHIDYQADPRKSVPFRGILQTPNNTFALKDQPFSGVGPWFSTDRIGWHRNNLTEMRRIGLDVALVEVAAFSAAADASSDKALLTMAAALRDLRFEAQAAPAVALSLDLSVLVRPNAGGNANKRIDLATVEGRALLYRNVARFLRLVAPEFRAESQLPPENGGGRVYPIFLSGREGATNWNARVDGKTWAADLRARFASEFGAATGGTTLLFVGDNSFADDADEFAATLPKDANGIGNGLLPLAVVSPGRIFGKTVLSRRDGQTYQKGWEAATEANWVVVDSWNDFGDASEIVASRQHGSRYLDLTRTALTNRYQKSADRAVKWFQHNAPRRLALGATAQVDITLQNVARLPLRGEPIGETRGVALAYRWLKNGRVVGEMLAPPPAIRVALYPGDVATIPLTVIAAAQQPGADSRILPLAPGDYYLQVDFFQRGAPLVATGEKEKPRYFSDDGVRSLSIPVEIIGEPDEAIEWGGVSGSTLLFSGGYYPTLLRARWMGKEPLLPADAQIAYQILNEDGTQTIAAGAFPLDAPLTPGRWAILRAPLRLSDAGGTALAPALPEGVNRGETGGYYRVRWLLTRTNATTSLAGEYLDTIAVYPSEDEARVLPPTDKISEMDAGERNSINVTVINRGFSRWAKGTAFVGYHWYHADGIEAQWKPTLAARIDRDVEPGQSVTVPVLLVAPERPGAYTITFDVTRNGPDNYLSTRAVSRVGDIALAQVRVTDGRLRFLELTKLFDTDAVAYENNPTDGDVNGVGSTLPGEFFVPDRFGANAAATRTRTVKDKEGKTRTKTTTVAPPPYPSGYYGEFSSARAISFRYGAASDGAKNAIACNGQSLPLESGRYIGLHLAALSVGGQDRPLSVTLRYKNKTTQIVNAVVGDWGRSSTNAEPAALTSPIRRTPNGDTATPSTLYHIILPVDVTRELVGIVLPVDTKIKLFAATLEK